MDNSEKTAGRTLDGDIQRFSESLEKFLATRITPAMFRAKRVPMGIYEQRQDGNFMQRIRVPCGRMTSDQLTVVSETAAACSREPLHVTTRQDIQIHALEIAKAVDSMRRLAKAGLSSRGGGGNTVRNITACTYAGICPAKLFDVQPYADAVTDYMMTIDGAYNLPRKYKISFSECRCDCACGRINDLGFIAEVRDGRAGFRVFAGGGMGAGSRIGGLIEEWIPANECLAAAEAMRRIFDRHGNRKNKHKARLRFVFALMGEAAVLKEYNEEKCGLLRDGFRLDLPDAGLNASAEPLRPALGNLNGAWVMRQSGGDRVAVRLFLEDGLIGVANGLQIADVVKRFSVTDSIRFTMDQGVLIESVKVDHLSELVECINLISPGLLDRGWHASMVACAGSATCRLGLCLSRDLVKECESEFARRGITPDGLEEELIRVNGCPNACAKHLVGGIGLSGAARRENGRLYPAYTVFLGGRGGADPAFGDIAGAVPAKSVPALLVDILSDYKTGRAAPETFAEYVRRKGVDSFAGLIYQYSKLPENAEEAGYTRDWGSDVEFSLAGRGAGECGSGVFEVVSGDIDTANSALQKALSGAGPAVLGDAFLATVRALLIVRGIDVVEPDAIVREFEKHFVDTGLVDEAFRGVLTRGRAYLSGLESALAGQAKEVQSLLLRVRALYDSLDASLQFQIATPGATRVESQAPVAGSHRMDLKGVACPMNFVKAKLKLETINFGETLEILLDDGEPVKNVPESFRQQGQEITGMLPDGTGHWKVIVKKTLVDLSGTEAKRDDIP